MGETAADVRRDIEMTRERMSDTIAQLEQKMNLMQIVKDHPWPALGVAFAAGILLSGSRADVKAAAASVAATQGASSKIGGVLDDLVANLVTGVQDAFQHRVDGWVTELKTAIGAPTNTTGAPTGATMGATSAPPARVADLPERSAATASSGGLTGEVAGAGLGNQLSGQEARSASTEWQPQRAD